MKIFKGQTIIITGGSRGIGKGCCLAFAKQGANVVFTYNQNTQAADEVKKEIQAGKSGKCIGVQADVRDYNQCRKVVEAAIAKFKKIDILINNAGIIRDKALLMMTQEDWKDVIDTNLNGVFNMTRSLITTFLKQKRGCVINMSSVSGLVGVARQTNYSAAKAGIIGFSKALAKEVAPYNIRVNVVCPGFIRTDMVYSIPDAIQQEIVKHIPLGRLGTVEEISQMCLYLASDKASYITGEVIKIDGGLAI